MQNFNVAHMALDGTLTAVVIPFNFEANTRLPVAPVPLPPAGGQLLTNMDPLKTLSAL